VDRSGTEDRIVSPSETFERIRASIARVGVTRLAEVTGLDRVGIPVVIAVRPDSRGLSTNAGKGVTLDAALVSAGMEALETFHAERLAPHLRRISYHDLRRNHAAIDASRIPIRKDASFNRDWPHDWVLGWDLLNGVETAVPLRMVSLDVTGSLSAPPAYDFPLFQSSSNGLASGNHILEAMLASLLEVIERDAMTCWSYSHATRPPARIDPRSFASPQLEEVLDRLASVAIRVILCDCTCDTGVPVFRAVLCDEMLPGIGLYHGSAAHLKPEVACLKAILEAVQSRAVYIAGSRDDCFQEDFRVLRRSAYAREFESFMMAGSTGPCPRYPAASTSSLEGDVAVLTNTLRRAGVEQIVAIDMSRADFPVHVTKVIAPGLEGPSYEGYAPGPRALRAMREPA
jgi:ribosomal protein S12 methylthiotransferase accessory factor